MRSLSLLVLLTLFSTLSFSQSKRYDRKGQSVLIDAGLQFLDADLEAVSGESVYKLSQSRSASISYYKRINFSPKWSVNPGASISSNKYGLGSGYQFVQPAGESYSELALLSSGAVDVSKSFLSATYVDIPFELLFQAAEGKPFRFAVGAKFGLLVKGMSKVKVKYQGESKSRIIKTTGTFGLNPIRYGTYARLGYGPINVFAYYSLSELFENGSTNGLQGSGGTNLNFNPITIGITIDPLALLLGGS